MAKSKNKKRGFVHVHHLTRVTACAGIGVLLFGGAFYSYAAVPRTQPLSKAPTTITHHPLAARAPKTVPKPAAPPPQATTPAPASTPAPAPASQPAAQPAAPAAVTPSPSSSVDNLTPTSTPASSPAPDQTSTPTQNSSPISPSASYSSTNWSGYLSAGGYYTAVSGSWTVPAVATGVTSESGDAAWIGIGGVTSDDLIQIGTENIVEPNGQVYRGAFYELLPDVSQPVPGITLHAGDTVTASIVQASATTWTMSITDTATGASYTSTVTYASTNSSAEWVEEDPSYASGSLVPFDDFGSVTFSGASTTVNGTAMSISDAQGSPITMLASPGHVVVAQPSALTGDGAGFTVTRKNAN